MIGLKEHKIEKETDIMQSESSKCKIILTGCKPSEWACARHWLLGNTHSLPFLKDMKNLFKQGYAYAEKEKQGIINCYNTRPSRRRVGMFKNEKAN